MLIAKLSRQRPLSHLQAFQESIEARETACEDFFIAETNPPPAFEHTIDANGFDGLKLAVLQISIVDHFAQPAQSLVFEIEAFQQCLEGAVAASLIMNTASNTTPFASLRCCITEAI